MANGEKTPTRPFANVLPAPGTRAADTADLSAAPVATQLHPRATGTRISEKQLTRTEPKMAAFPAPKWLPRCRESSLGWFLVGVGGGGGPGHRYKGGGLSLQRAARALKLRAGRRVCVCWGDNGVRRGDLRQSKMRRDDV